MARGIWFFLREQVVGAGTLAAIVVGNAHHIKVTKNTKKVPEHSPIARSISHSIIYFAEPAGPWA
jgi:hypothetical protein